MLDAGRGVAVADKAWARHFELQIPLRYGANMENDWHRITTRNISRSAALF